MPNPDKKPRKTPKTVRPGAQRPPRAEAFDIEAIGPVTAGEDGKPRQLPSLIDTVSQMLLMYRRRTIVDKCKISYSCSASTVDRAIAVAKEERLAYARLDREERIAEGIEHFKSISLAAHRNGKFQAARAARRDMHALAGDLKPETVLIYGADKPAEVLLAQADELMRKANEARERHRG